MKLYRKTTTDLYKIKHGFIAFVMKKAGTIIEHFTVEK
jgi:hypothetical protein